MARAQEGAHRITGLHADATIHMLELVAVPIDLAAFAPHQHIAVGMQAPRRVGLAAWVSVQRKPLLAEAGAERAIDLVGRQQQQAALPRHRAIFEMDASAQRRFA